MFTGLVEEVGRVERVERRAGSLRLVVAAERVIEGTRVGDSLAVSGACLTVTRVWGGKFEVDVVEETVRRTNLIRMRTGSRVNLERSLKLGDRLGGHLVLGHVDGLATVVSVDGSAAGQGRLRARAPAGLEGLIVEKGSVALDGVSLTVADVRADAFSVALIPHTLQATTLGRAAAGDGLNLEVDVLARYVARQLGREGEAGGIGEEWLRMEGYA